MNTPQRRIAVEEAVAYGLLAAVGGYAFVTSFGYGLLLEGNRVGPGLLPAVFGGLIALISSFMLILTLRGRRARHDHGLAEVAQSVQGRSPDESRPAEAAGTGLGASGDLDIFGRTAAQRMRQLRIVTVALIVALILVPVVGLLGALGLFGLFASIVVEKRPWLSSVLITAMSISVVYVVFARLLEVPLPAGALGIGG